MALTVSSDAGVLSRLAAVSSKPLCIRYACHLEQPEGASWFGSHDRPASSQDINAQHSLVDRYAETLWLGEHHTGLAHFLNCIERLKSSHDLDDVLLGLCQLIRSNSAITRRHRALAYKLLPEPDKLDNSTAMDVSELSVYEMTLASRVVGTPTSGLRSTGLESLRERWISSMESREIQLQILITMCLLQIVSQDPRALETARSRIRGNAVSIRDTPADTEAATAADTESEQPRKRSRKLEKAKRWRGARPHSGSSDAFAWNQQVCRRLATDSSHDDNDNAESEVLEMQGEEVLAVDHLSKRLEALVDILCLRQVAAGVGSEIADLLSDFGAESSVEHEKQGKATSKAKGTLFGSSVRKLVEDDDMDDAQWLCSRVVEPHFEASLPRQCSLFRSKCFVSLSSRTPARPTKSVRTGSAGSPPMRAAKRSASAATAAAAAAAATAAAGMGNVSIAGAGLSDVLEKEQAGRRVKRNILAERSSMLGRGREVDMGRRLSRSVSATSGPGHEVRAPTGVFSRSNTNATYTQPTSIVPANPFKSGTSVERGHKNGRYASQGIESHTMHSPALAAAMPPFGSPFTCSSSSFASGSKRLLVMSTPQKQPANKAFSMDHLSQLDKPRLVLPRNSLVMESPTQTQDGSQLLGARSRMAERCASFAGRSSFALDRSPSPVAFHSDADE